jgi:N utilization substance protein B
MTASGAWARRRARRAAVQAVYQWQMTAADAHAVEQEFLESGALRKADEEFFRALLRGVMFGSEALDELLTPLLDRRVAELDKVELALLRLGAYELKERQDVPFRVVIDEYVGLAKVFGAEDSFKYINGVLDRLAVPLRPLERPSS